MGSEVQDREFERHLRQRHQLATAVATAAYSGDVPVGCVRPRSPEHRRTDWRTPAAPGWTCGLCHPPAIEFDGIERRA